MWRQEGFSLLELMVAVSIFGAAEERMQTSAKVYGMLILERLWNAVGGVGERVELVANRDGDLVLKTHGTTRVIPMQSLIPDETAIAELTRCVTLVSRGECTPTAEHLVRSWDLRLVSQFDTDVVIRVTVSQARDEAIAAIYETTSSLPYLMSIVALTVSFGVIHYLRRRFDPVPALEGALREIERGNFNHRVSIETNDEFADLGGALNAMSEELASSFGFRETASLIDQQILAGRDLEQILLTICRSAVEDCGVGRAMVLMPGDSTVNMVGFDGRVECRESVMPLPASTWESRWGCSSALQVFGDRAQWGWIAFDRDVADDSRLRELAHKASVAVTNQEQSAQLFDQANYDGLTRLLNRVAFTRELDALVADRRRRDGIAALIFLDLDNFKKINDTEGHSIGDEVLQAVAERLRFATRDIDVLARFGGDEFAVALRSIDDTHGVLNVLQRIRDAIEQPIPVGRFEHIVSCSMGVCLIPQDGSDSETLLRKADVAMYKAKEIPGTSYIYFNEAYNAETERRVLVEGKLREAIDTGLLRVYLQPKLDLRSNRIDTYEALLRWQDDVLGVVAPAEFVDIAERAGIVEDMTEGVVRRVGAILQSHDEDDVRAIAINVSPVHLGGSQFADRFLASLKKHGCPPSRVEVEVTESVFLADQEEARRKLLKLKQAGLKISLDDFGTGYSSLNLLTQLPIDVMKIDKSFVDDIPSQTRNTAVIGKMVEMAGALGIQVVAEGVEEQDQLDALREMGTEYIQGYVVCEPLPAEEAIEFVRDWNARQEDDRVISFGNRT